MISSRFFPKMKNLFGTPLLQMSQNTIKRLSKSNKFHLSSKKTFLSSKDLNILTIQNNTQINLKIDMGIEENDLDNKIQKFENNVVEKDILQKAIECNFLFAELQRSLLMKCILDGGTVPSMNCSN